MPDALNEYLPAAAPADLRPFRDALASANYSEKGLIEKLGPVRLPAQPSGDLSYFLHLTRGGSPLDTMIRLFLFGVDVEGDDAARALGPAPLAAWKAAGLIEQFGGGVRARVRLLPFRGLVLACDQQRVLDEAGLTEQVMGITASTAAVADFAVDDVRRRTLDLGAGSGALALLAASRSERVTASDCSPRCINFARFNAALNGIENVHCAVGDAFEPVQGQRFDLVLSNPPFAITPSFRYRYRDSGMELDGFCRALRERAPAFLNEGGLCQIACDWAHIAGEDWQERIAGWLEGTGCDAWVLRLETHDAAAYAEMWIRDTERAAGEEAARLFGEWMRYYESRGIEAVSTGLIALRRSARGSHWIRIEDAPATSGGAIGGAIRLGFELRDYLEACGAEERLLEERLRVAPGVRLDQECEWEDAGWRVSAATIRLSGGLHYQSPIDLRLAAMLALSDGRRTLRELITTTAEAVQADAARITPNLIVLTRQLVERGFLLPASIADPPAPGPAPVRLG
jgi:SAM-dependent methyltransferase